MTVVGALRGRAHAVGEGALRPSDLSLNGKASPVCAFSRWIFTHFRRVWAGFVRVYTRSEVGTMRVYSRKRDDALWKEPSRPRGTGLATPP
jgi:hypothetical protein